MNKLTREIDGHKFYSKAYDTEKEAKENALKGYYALYEDGKWFNYNQVLGFQEGVHVKPENKVTIFGSITGERLFYTAK